MALADAIKLAARGAVDAQQPAGLVLGRVATTEPLRVQVSPRLMLEGAALLSLTGLELRREDTVALLRDGGGQRYLVLGTVEGGSDR